MQGSDYFYTIHGWLKGINSDALLSNSDGGKDGALGNKYLASYTDVHRWLSPDAMNFSLNYYNTASDADYQPIKTFTTSDGDPLMSVRSFSNNAHPFYMDNNSASLAGDGPDLFNGNISSMNTSIIDKDPSNAITNNAPFPLLTAYRYDQLHRLKSMKSFRSYSVANSTWNAGSSGNYDDAYKMNFTYDNNGNILSLLRNGPGNNLVSGSSLNMDNLSYSYYNTSVTNCGFNSNRLRCVPDAVTSSNYSDDVDDALCDNFEYMVIGG